MRKFLLITILVVLALCGVAALVPGKPLAFRSEVFVELPLSRSWVLLSDLSLAHEYVPGIQRTELVGDKTTGVGASRRVFSSERDYILETVTDWREREGFTLDLHDDDGVARNTPGLRIEQRAGLDDRDSLVAVGRGRRQNEDENGE